MKRQISLLLLAFISITLFGQSNSKSEGKAKSKATKAKTALSKEEKKVQKWIDSGEKLENGVVRVTLPGNYLSLLNDGGTIASLETRSMLIWKEANSKNAFYYCIPFDNISALFPRGILPEIDNPMTSGSGWLYDGNFTRVNDLSWFGKVENGLLEGKGYGFTKGEKNNYFFCGEFHNGIPSGDLYCVNPNGEMIYKKPKEFRESLATSNVRVFPFNDGYARIIEKTSKGYSKSYINMSLKKVMYLDGAFVKSLFQNCGNTFQLDDFSDFHNGRATISFFYKYKDDKEPRGVLKMEIDTDLAFAGFEPESDVVVSALLDRIIDGQIKTLNTTDLKDPRTTLEKRGIDYGDYRFCTDLRMVLGKTYEGSKYYETGSSNPAIIQAFPHLWKRLEMIHSLEELFRLISGQLTGYRRLMNEEARRGHLRKSGIDKEWMNRMISKLMTNVRTLSSDPIFPKMSISGVKTLENEINKIDKEFLAAYNDANKANDETLARKAAERREAAERRRRQYSSGGGWSSRNNSSSDQSLSEERSSDDETPEEQDIENMEIPSYKFTTEWQTAILRDEVTNKYGENQIRDIEFSDGTKAQISQVAGEDGYWAFNSRFGGKRYRTLEDVVAAAYIGMKYGKVRQKGRW